ncbi:hypothetical protein SADUNF_Sadunf01G0078500 [Salix dunnii]|uniref:beta-carotene 3-hydroxylase n=1 Tax=Salix dunnii TaxID=1413687 RepID=A0A835NAE1_9ROSI|nr:hypothetical protein SADUNF_Sadunf01G0078500 [Salix dunnii]
MAVHYRFLWQMEGGEFPLLEMFGTFALSVGAVVLLLLEEKFKKKKCDEAFLLSSSSQVGMEFLGEVGSQDIVACFTMADARGNVPFELNDVFAIINAVPAIALFSYGFFNKGLLPGLCFGADLGITVFGMAYMFVHDGLVHQRFPVGPVANVPYLRRVAAAHQPHHADKFDGVPYGLFLGPNELEEVGGLDELVKEVQRRIKSI